MRVTPPPIGKANREAVTSGDMVLMEYVGAQVNTHRIVGKVTQTAYRFGNIDSHRQKYVFKQDVPFLLSFGKYKVVEKSNSIPPPQDLMPLVIRERPHATH